MKTTIETPAPVYQARWTLKGKEFSGPTEHTPGLAASHIPAAAKVATVLRDSRGADHPDNAGKFFLYQIIR